MGWGVSTFRGSEALRCVMCWAFVEAAWVEVGPNGEQACAVALTGCDKRIADRNFLRRVLSLGEAEPLFVSWRVVCLDRSGMAMSKVESSDHVPPDEVLFGEPVFLLREAVCAFIQEGTIHPNGCKDAIHPPIEESANHPFECEEPTDSVVEEHGIHPWGWEEDELFRLAHSPEISEAEPDILFAAGLSREARLVYILSNPFWLLSLCGLILAIGGFSLDLYLQNRPLSLDPPEASGARTVPQAPRTREPSLSPPMQQLQQRIARIARDPLPSPYRFLRETFAPKSLPIQGDWLKLQHEEGQSFEEYKASQPVRPSVQRKVIYLQPLGEMSAYHQRVVLQVARYMEAFFCSRVVLRPAWERLPLPPWATREKPQGNLQLHTPYVLFHILKPRLPKDAMMLIALTQHDLWPGMGWSYVFGQASLSERVGVWSMARYGDPSHSPKAFQQLLIRTLKTSLHEAGHILSLPHCIGHDCVMNGSNHLEEADRHPAFLCPHCMAKLCWNLGCDPIRRLEILRDLSRQMGLSEIEAQHSSALRLLRPVSVRKQPPIGSHK